jgi:hypothetical protein
LVIISFIPLLKGSGMTRTKEHFGIVLLLVFLWTLGFCPTAPGVEFAGGTGEPNAPYQIATAEQLFAVGSDPNLLRKHYQLVADIDLGGATRSQAVILTFSGTFDGNGHIIRNLHIDGEGSQALFDALARGGEVKNLGVVDANVIGSGNPAALVAFNFGSVRNCYSTGSVTGRQHSGGGLVGLNIGTIACSWSTAAVAGQVFVGGLVGENTGSIISCYASGNVTAATDAGGLAGLNGGAISCCYSTGRVAAALDVGGLVAVNGGSIDSCYSIAGVTCAGGNYLIRYVGGLVGNDHSGSPAQVNSCWFLAPADGGGPDNGIGMPLTNAQMKQKSGFTGWDFWDSAADGINDQWFMPTDACPVLVWQADITGLTPVPDVVGLPLEQAKAALTTAGFIVGTIDYENASGVVSGCISRTYPHSFALPGGTINLFVRRVPTR